MPKKTEAAQQDPSPDDDLVKMEFRGETFTIPRHRSDWSTRGTVAVAEQKFNVAVKHILGPDQWELLCELAPTNGDFSEFFTLFAATAKRECID